MDIGSFSIGMTAGFIIGLLAGIGIVVRRLKNAFKHASQSFEDFFKDSTLENDPSKDKGDI